MSSPSSGWRPRGRQRLPTKPWRFTTATSSTGLTSKRRRLRSGSAQRGGGRGDGGTPEALDQAVALYHGDFLDGFDVKEAPFEEWLVSERERLRELALEALAKLLAHETQAGLTEQGIQTAVRLLALDPLQEAVHRSLMRLYARQGRRGAALRPYQVCLAGLQRGLGGEPAGG